MRFWACRLTKNIINTKTLEVIHPKGSFIAIDSASGGYPYAVDNPSRMFQFSSEKDAKAYAAHWPPNKQYSQEWERLIAYELETVLVEATFTVVDPHAKVPNANP